MNGAGKVGDVEFIKFKMRLHLAWFSQFRQFCSRFLWFIVSVSNLIISWLRVVFPVNDSSSHPCCQTSNVFGEDPLLLWLFNNHI